MAAIAALGEAELQEGAIEQVAGVVPGEEAARLVGALQPRRQTDHQQAGVQRPERRYRRIVKRWKGDRKSTRLNSSHSCAYHLPSAAGNKNSENSYAASFPHMYWLIKE